MSNMQIACDPNSLITLTQTMQMNVFDAKVIFQKMHFKLTVNIYLTHVLTTPAISDFILPFKPDTTQLTVTALQTYSNTFCA